MLKGIDVSSYQGFVDWFEVKAEGWQFAILKVMRKDLEPDKQFENNWKNCGLVGMVIQGVYNYTYATTVEKAISDAKRVLEILGKDRHPFVWLDYEDKCLPKDKLAADIINAYGDVITSGGCKFGVYFGQSFYNSYLDKIIDYVKPEYRNAWEARYYNGYKEMNIDSEINISKKPKGFKGIFFGWQYSSSGKVRGIKGSVDLDLWYEDIEADKCFENSSDDYTIEDFLSDSADVWGTNDKNEMFDRTVTVSTTSNKNHAIVTPLERYMKSLGFYTGSIEADNGKKPIFGNGMKKAIILYQQKIVKALKRYQDGILTAKKSTWKTLYK